MNTYRVTVTFEGTMTEDELSDILDEALADEPGIITSMASEIVLPVGDPDADPTVDALINHEVMEQVKGRSK